MEDGGYSGECRFGTDADTRDGAIDKNENGSDGIGDLLDMIHNALLMELILLNTAGVAQPWCVKDANLEKLLCTFTTFTLPTLTIMPFLLVNSYSRAEMVWLWFLEPPCSSLWSRISKS